MTTRLSAVAGLFYPSDPDRLRTHVLDLLADVAASTKVMPKALTAPHAGYAYSGRAAAAIEHGEWAGLGPRANPLILNRNRGDHPRERRNDIPEIVPADQASRRFIASALGYASWADCKCV